MWLFSSVRHWGTYNYIAGLYDDLDPTALFYTPDLSSPAIQPVWHVNGDARLTVQATPRNKINAYYHYQYSDFGTCLEPYAADRAFGVRSQQERPAVVCPGELELAPDQSECCSRRAARSRPRTRPGRRDPDVPANLSAITESSTGFTWRAPTGGFGGTRNNQSNYRAAVSYVTGTHAAKVGLTLMQQWRVVGNDRNNGVNYTFFNGVPSRLTQFAEPITFPSA